MVIGWTVWGPKVRTLKGTEASFSYVQWFLYLLSSLINISILHMSLCLCTFIPTCTVHTYIHILLLCGLDCYKRNCWTMWYIFSTFYFQYFTSKYKCNFPFLYFCFPIYVLILNTLKVNKEFSPTSSPY